ncbi:MAG: hypothetical protein KAX05_01425 [Bacteroidales bacterium]|nr:hypothetical protein [Bacteroidales bacterium]
MKKGRSGDQDCGAGGRKKRITNIEQGILNFELRIIRTRVAHAPTTREIFTHYGRSNVVDLGFKIEEQTS